MEIFILKEDSHGDHDLDSIEEFAFKELLVPHIHISPYILLKYCNCASWALESSVTPQEVSGGETLKSTRARVSFCIYLVWSGLVVMRLRVYCFELAS